MAAGRSRDAERDRVLLGGSQRARPPPGDLLEREPQRLGVGELAVEQLQSGPQRRELVVGELDRPAGGSSPAEASTFSCSTWPSAGFSTDSTIPSASSSDAVGVEAPREGVLVHRAVPLDVAPDLRSRDRPALGHQVGDQRELTDQLLCVLGHRSKFSWAVLRRSHGRLDGALFAQFWSQGVGRRDKARRFQPAYGASGESSSARSPKSTPSSQPPRRR